MKRATLLCSLGLGFIGAVGGAVLFDSSGAVQQAFTDLQESDHDLRQQEERFIGAVSGGPADGDSFREALARYRAATASISERHRLFNELVIEVKRAAGSVDNPFSRRFADEIAGALNRRDIESRHFGEMLAACQRVVSGFRGRISHRALGTPIECD